MEKLYTVSKKKKKKRPRIYCGLDHELLIAKFRIKSKKVGKTYFQVSGFRSDHSGMI